MPTILDEIVGHKRQEIARAKRQCPLAQLEEQVAVLEDKPRNFRAALRGERVRVIAEIKRASPSEGQIVKSLFDPRILAQDYAGNGAAAISVLTDLEYFGGELAHLRRARSMMPLPVLRKDFTIDPYQIYETRLYRGDAVLLIAAILDRYQLRDFLRIVEELRMGALVEVHDGFDLDLAMDAGAKVIGINNRDLNTMEVSLETTLRLAPQVPQEFIVVSESGIKSADDVARVAEVGVDAVLVGTALMKAEEPGRALLPLTRVEANVGARTEG